MGVEICDKLSLVTLPTGLAVGSSAADPMLPSLERRPEEVGCGALLGDGGGVTNIISSSLLYLLTVDILVLLGSWHFSFFPFLGIFQNSELQALQASLKDNPFGPTMSLKR